MRLAKELIKVGATLIIGLLTFLLASVLQDSLGKFLEMSVEWWYLTWGMISGMTLVYLYIGIDRGFKEYEKSS